MDEMNIDIQSLIVHILDTNMQMPVLSQEEQLLDPDIGEFLQKHISRVLKDDGLKNAFFDEDSILMETFAVLKENTEKFIDCTSQMARNLYDIMLKNADIPSGDLCCCLFKLDSRQFFGLLKFNYRTSYIHMVHNDERGNINKIIRQKTALPGENQKVDECALICLEDMSIKLTEKKFEVDGEKVYYFSTMFLKCSGDISEKEKVKIFKKATKEFNKKFFAEDFTKAADIKQAVAESIEESESIDVESVAEKVFKRNPELRDSYIEHMEKSGIKNNNIYVDEKVSEKAFEKHKIKTDTGIEIDLPVDCYSNKDKIEFIGNPDGTISIVIKNINRITDV